MLVSPRWVYRAKMLGRAVWSHASEGPVLFLAVALGVGLPTSAAAGAFSGEKAQPTASAQPAAPKHERIDPTLTPPLPATAQTPQTPVAPLLGKGVTPQPRPGVPGLRKPTRQGHAPTGSGGR